MDNKFDLFLDFDDVAIDDYDWFDKIFRNMDVAPKLIKLLENRLKRATTSEADKRIIEVTLANLKHLRYNPALASDSYIREKVIDRDRLLRKRDSYYKKSHTHDRQGEYYRYAAKEINRRIQELNEEINSCYKMKDMILEEMSPEFIDKIPYDQILKIYNVKQEFIDFVTRAATDPRVDNIYIITHCNHPREEALKEYIISRIFEKLGKKVVFIPLLFHNREIDTFNEGSYTEKDDITPEVTSKYKYAQVFINQKYPDRDFKLHHSALIDNSLSNDYDFEKNGGSALLYCTKGINNHIIEQAEKKGFGREALTASLADYDTVMHQIENRFALNENKRVKTTCL